ncbi:DAO-domain-containing protein [Clavulina sp. PMI_390]|nr:DAO-domain-containing protein [Clavulina sp. PMI_390]
MHHLILQGLQAISELSQGFSRLHIHVQSQQVLHPGTSAEPLPWPGLPVTHRPSTASYWSAHNRGPNNALMGFGSKDELPRTADVVIIGAGISGVSTAHFLLNSDNPPENVVLLEAREVSSGATGRNGGFIKPVPFRTYADYKALFGTEEALKLIQSEYDTLDLTTQLVEELGIDVGFAMRPHREIVLDKATAAQDGRLLDLIREDRALRKQPQIDGVQWFKDTAEARAITRSKTAVEAYAYRCASIWPHKFVHALLTKLLSSPAHRNKKAEPRLRLFTQTPALSLHRVRSPSFVSPNPTDKTSDSPHPYVWHVHTPRGSILTPKLIITTNGYTSTLLPALFMGRIVPKRTQMAAYTPPMGFLSRGGELEFTFNIRGHYDNATWPSSGSEVDVISHGRARASSRWPSGFEEAYGLTTSDGGIVMGGELAQRASDRDGVPWLGEVDDSTVFTRTEEYYRWMPRVNFDGWDQASEGVGEGLIRSWTGIQGHTLDTLPFVGAVPGRRYEGLYVSAGFHGHGMARCLLASRGLVSQLLSPHNMWDERLPQSFAITKKRLNASAEEVMGELVRGWEGLGFVSEVIG